MRTGDDLPNKVLKWTRTSRGIELDVGRQTMTRITSPYVLLAAIVLAGCSGAGVGESSERHGGSIILSPSIETVELMAKNGSPSGSITFPNGVLDRGTMDHSGIAPPAQVSDHYTATKVGGVIHIDLYPGLADAGSWLEIDVESGSGRWFNETDAGDVEMGSVMIGNAARQDHSEGVP